MLLLLFLAHTGCTPKYEPRVYDAPKSESEFTKPLPPIPSRRPPMMGGNAIPLEYRRILGAVIPYDSVAYFLISTDTIDRLQLVDADFRTVVERFDIDVAKQELRFDLPPGWAVKWRSGEFSMAELNVDIPKGKPIQFTVTELSKPTDPADWKPYLLANINRWRGKLELPETDLAGLERDIPRIPRQGRTLPGYIFDAQGSGQSTHPAASTPQSKQTPVADAALRLSYNKPDAWEAGVEKPFRLATFNFSSGDRAGEVSIVKANNSPLDNAKMWCQQVHTDIDETIIQQMAEKSIGEAQDIQAGSAKGKLYSILPSGSNAPKGFLIAAIPTNEAECIFVKVTADPQSLDEQKPNLIRFVNSLRWE
ncbi:MAG: hypothetical protein ABL921_05840 [Pirellula sp.]